MIMEEQQLITKLREKGLKVTPQRLAVCRFVLSSKEHPTVEQACAVVRQEYPTISLATVYQTLHLLARIGLLHEMGSGDGSSRYDPNISPHLNVVCTNCGKIEDYESKTVREFVSQITDELKRTLIGQNLAIYAPCSRCGNHQIDEQSSLGGDTA